MTVFGIIAFLAGWLCGVVTILVVALCPAASDPDDIAEAEAEWLRAIEESRG